MAIIFDVIVSSTGFYFYFYFYFIFYLRVFPCHYFDVIVSSTGFWFSCSLALPPLLRLALFWHYSRSLLTL